MTTHAGGEPLIPVAPEFFVQDVASSVAFYKDVLGFAVLRQEPAFAVVALGDAHVLLAAESLVSNEWLGAGPRGAGVHVRIMSAGVPIVHDIADRYYGLRDFILTDPDGFCVRFAKGIARKTE